MSVKQGIIDVERINKALPLSVRKDVIKIRDHAIGGHKHRKTFTGIGTYGNRYKALPEGIALLEDLYPPNIAIIDFLLKYIKNFEEEVILDFGCGPGVLMGFLKILGFPNVYGLDNWDQITEEVAKKFLSYFELDDRLSTPEDWKKFPYYHDYTILIHSGIWCPIYSLASFPCLKYILSDSHFGMGWDGTISTEEKRNEKIPGFERILIYDSLLFVYERV